MSSTKLLASILALTLAQAATAQVKINSSGQNIQIGSDGSVSIQTADAHMAVGQDRQANHSINSSGQIDADVNISGVTIINGKLWIDGDEVPSGVKEYTSPKTGKRYKIDRKGQNIAVTSSD